MKRIFLITFLLVSMLARGQETFNEYSSSIQYRSMFGENSSIWTVKHENLHGVTTDTLKVLNDTIINDSIFRVINTPLKTIYLHEDLSYGRLSYYTNHDSTIKILMDLSLNIGDTFKVKGAWIIEPGYYEVDSVFIKDQRKHVRLNLPLYFANDEKLIFIEGIGPNTGLSYQDSQTGELGPYLLCYWRDDQQEFSNEKYNGECSIFSSMSSNIEKKRSINIAISPNPITSNYFYVTFNEPFKGQMFLMDIAGSVIFEKTITESLLQDIIVLSNIKLSGIYVLSFQNQEGATESKKITIIQ